MKKLMTARHWAGIDVAMAKSLLEAAGIACFIHKENLSMVAGGVPVWECYPELWVCEDADFERARAILQGDPATLENPPGSEC
jgi:hypothetical protein